MPPSSANDREPDAQQREAKTVLMQRVNRAHEANDLLALPELQLQIEQIEADHIANASEQRVKHYNKVLEQTGREWRGDLDRQQRELRMLGDIAATRRWLKRQRQEREQDELRRMPF